MAFAVYGAASLGPRAFEAGIAEAAAAAPGQRILVSVFLSGGADSLGILAPTGDPRYASLRPTLKQNPDEGTEFAGDPALRWHPAAGGLATLHGEGKLTVMPAIGYTGANQSHFTSRHYYEVGETNPYGRWGWLGRFLDQHGTADNPLQGLTLGYELQPSLAARNVPVATVARPDDYDFYAPGVWDPIATPMLDAFGELGELPTSDAGLAYARSAVAATGGLRRQLAPFQDGFSSPVAYPNTEFGRRLSALAAMIKENLPLRVVALEADGSYDTHSNQAQEISTKIGSHGRGAAGLPAGPRGARHRRPRAGARVERVRPPAAGERLGHRPRGGRPGLRDGPARVGRDGGRVPGAGPARRGRQPALDLGLPRRLRGADGAVDGRGRGLDRARGRLHQGVFARPNLVA